MARQISEVALSDLYHATEDWRPGKAKGFAVWEGELQLFGGITTGEVLEACEKLVEQIEEAKAQVAMEEVRAAQASMQEGREAEARGQDERY